jgi:hypothetical protein
MRGCSSGTRLHRLLWKTFEVRVTLDNCHSPNVPKYPTAFRWNRPQRVRQRIRRSDRLIEVPEGAVPKPTDLFIGIIDFFAVLVPGVAAVLVVCWAVNFHVPEKQDISFLGTVLVAGFVLGHILHGLGSFLDIWVYDPLFKPLDDKDEVHGLRRRSYFRANDKLYRASKNLTVFSVHGSSADGGKDVGTKTGQLPVGIYQWARAWLRIHSPEATAELDRLEADSKLFRSLSVLALAVLICFKLLPARTDGLLPLAFFMTVICLWRYCDLRQKMVRACYLHFVLLRSDSAESHHEKQKHAIS